MAAFAQRGAALLKRALSGLERIAELRGRVEAAPAHRTTGFAGGAVFFYLRRKGYTVVARRWPSGEVPGDVDLIAWLALACVLCGSEDPHGTRYDAR
jgi:putative endonuclease